MVKNLGKMLILLLLVVSEIAQAGNDNLSTELYKPEPDFTTLVVTWSVIIIGAMLLTAALMYLFSYFSSKPEKPQG